MNAIQLANQIDKIIEDQEAAKRYASSEQAQPDNKHCTKCGGWCPRGTLDNGLCNECDLIGKMIYVRDWPTHHCQVTRISRRGTIYAKRLYTSKGGWSKERPVHYYKGVYWLGGKHKSN